MSNILKEQINSVEQLKRTFSNFKRKEKTALSNYIPDPTKHTKYVENGITSAYKFDAGIFLTFDLGYMVDVIYMTKSKDSLMNCLEIIQEDAKKPLVVEHVFREGRDEQLGIPTKLLRRMSRVGVFEKPLPSRFAEQATYEDIPELLDIFSQYFDPYTERIPDVEELKRLIGMDGIRIIREKEDIIGMVVFEKSVGNLHLRYWWVSSSHRNKGIGADLLKAYFNVGFDCKRQFLWVFSDNTNAIDKYRHYGFEFDGTADEIFVI